MEQEQAPPHPPSFPFTPEQAERMRQEIRGQMAPRAWQTGRRYKCPRCGHRSLEGHDDMTFEVPKEGVVYSYRRLRGAACSGCGAQFLEPSALVEIEPDLLGLFRPDFEVRVSAIGRTLGTYWTQDIVRNLGLAKGEPAKVTIIGPKTALFRFS